MSRIIHVITRFVNGGADENTLLTCNHQAEAGHDVWLVYGAEATPRMLALLDSRVKAVSMPSLVREVAPVSDVAALFATVRLFRDIRPDIVHTHTSKAGVVGRLASLAVPRARVVHGVHILPFTGEPLPKRLAYLVLEKIAALRTHAFVDVSEGMRDLCLENGLGTRSQHHVIRSGMDVERFRHALPAQDVVAAASADTGGSAPLIVLYAAVLERRKRHRELMATLLPLLRANTLMHFFMAGDGPERGALEAMAEAGGCRDQVHLLGFRDDIESVISAADICVFASEREGLPRSIVQYAIVGKPIVTTELPGIDLVVREGENGHVVPSNDFDLLAAHIARLADDVDARTKLGKGGATIDFSRWDARTMTTEIEAVYESINPSPSSGTKGKADGVGAAAPSGRS